jgi:hypothetical protein
MTGIGQFARIHIEYTDDDWNELMQWGVHTGIRDAADQVALLDAAEPAMREFFTVSPACHLTRIAYSHWQTGPGFTGWHQQAAETLTDTAGSGTSLPPQLAVVVGLREIFDTSVPLGRRRNRFFIGPLASGETVTNGQISTARQGDYRDWTQALHEALQTVPGVDTPDFDGLCVTSPTAGLGWAASVSVVGRAVDTHRSRRQKVNEQPLLTTLV